MVNETFTSWAKLILFSKFFICSDLLSDVSEPVIGCSLPGVPEFIYFTGCGPYSVEISWTYPYRSAEQIGVSSYDIYLDDNLGRKTVYVVNLF